MEQKIAIYELVDMNKGRRSWAVVLSEKQEEGGWKLIKTIKKFHFDDWFSDNGASSQRARKQAELFAKRSRRARGIKEVSDG